MQNMHVNDHFNWLGRWGFLSNVADVPLVKSYLLSEMGYATNDPERHFIVLILTYLCWDNCWSFGIFCSYSLRSLPSLPKMVSISKILSASLYQKHKYAAMQMELLTFMPSSHHSNKKRAVPANHCRWSSDKPHRMHCAERCENECHSVKRAFQYWREHSGPGCFWYAVKRWKTLWQCFPPSSKHTH